MYKFTPGDIMHSGKTDMDSVKRCLEFVVGKRTPTEADLAVTDFNMDGKIDLLDTLKVLQISELQKKSVYVDGKNVRIDDEMIKGNILGVLLHLSTPVDFTTALDVDSWLSIQNNKKVYIENIINPSRLSILGSVSDAGCYVTQYEVVFESNDVMYYTHA